MLIHLLSYTYSYAGTCLTSRGSRKQSNNSRDTFRCQTDAFKFIPRRLYANVAAISCSCFFDVNGLRLIYVPYIIYKSSPRASGVRLSHDKARRILLPTSKINLGNSALMPIFLICFLGKEALCVSAAWKVELIVARNEKRNYRAVENGLLTQIRIKYPQWSNS